MGIIDKMFRFGSTFRLLVFVAATVTVALTGFSNSTENTGVFLILFGGLFGIRREFGQWRENKQSRP